MDDLNDHLNDPDIEEIIMEETKHEIIEVFDEDDRMIMSVTLAKFLVS